MKDKFGREIDYLRISITDRCNFFCKYCTTHERSFIPHERIMRYEEIVNFASIAKELGIKKVRITGGEPLVRLGVENLIGMLSALNFDDLAMTTNGFFLAEKAPILADNGLRRVNISLDTLDRDHFQTITGVDALPRVLDGIDVAKELFRVKINTVAMRSYMEDYPELVRFAVEKGIEIRFIELMPSPSTVNWEEEFLPTDELISYLAERGIIVEGKGEVPTSGPAVVYTTSSGGRIGFITSITKPFCDKCRRIRLTSDGRVRPCLGRDEEYDIMPYLRPEFRPDELRDKLREIIYNKPFSHEYYGLWKRNMGEIGG